MRIHGSANLVVTCDSCVGACHLGLGQGALRPTWYFPSAGAIMLRLIELPMIGARVENDGKGPHVFVMAISLADEHGGLVLLLAK